MNWYEWLYYWTLMLLKDFREPLLSFELTYFRNSFCYRIKYSWGFRYKILYHVGPLGKNLNFLSPLGSLTFQNFLSFLFILKLSYSKPFHNTLNCASAANIEEVMKFYNLGDKTFETDFSPIGHCLLPWQCYFWRVLGTFWLKSVGNCIFGLNRCPQSGLIFCH